MKYFINKELLSKLQKKGDIEWTLPERKKCLFKSTKAESQTIALLKQECNNYDELIAKLIYAPNERIIVEFYKQSGLNYKDFNVRY